MRARVRAARRRSLREAAPPRSSELPEPLSAARGTCSPRTSACARAVAACATATCPRSARLLDASHASLRDLYEVSTPAVEATVERLRDGRRGGRADDRRRLRR